MFVWMCQQAIAFRDVNPVAPIHVLVIPRKPITQLAASNEEDIPVSTKSFYYPSCRVGLKIQVRSGLYGYEHQINELILCCCAFGKWKLFVLYDEMVMSSMCLSSNRS